jgi:tetratricopeptide (TPR) repeat protein
LQSTELRNRKLTKIRYLTDGGYYDAANEVFETVSEHELKSEKDRVEFYYRKARLYHKTNQTKSAMEYYQKTVAESSTLQTYFAPNACLQLGYLFEEKKDLKNAELYYKKALAYKRHEYKNSIDTKARSALAQLKDRK